MRLDPNILAASRPVPMDRWGKDHWSTFMYVETRCVDHGGKLNPSQMREDGVRYPTCLSNGDTIPYHSDWNCVRDMKEEELLVVLDNRCIVLTDKGWEIAGKLRRWRAEGNNVGDFRPNEK